MLIYIKSRPQFASTLPRPDWLDYGLCSFTFASFALPVQARLDELRPGRVIEEPSAKQLLENQPERGVDSDTTGLSRMADEQGDILIEDTHQDSLPPFVETVHWIGAHSVSSHGRNQDRNHGERKGLAGVSAPDWDVRRAGG